MKGQYIPWMTSDRGARLLVVGLDGATWAVAAPMIAEGKLPNLAALQRRGAAGVLESTLPFMTLPAWSSAITGSNPGVHGIFDFVAREGYRLAWTHAGWRGVPTLFEHWAARGARVASVAVPTTWPPSPLLGAVISGFDSPVATRAGASHVRPASLYRAIQRHFGGMAFADFQELRAGSGWHEAALAAMQREIGRKEAIAQYLLRQERWDALMIVFGETDTVSHHFWRFHDPRSPRAPHRASPRLRGAVEDIYARADRALGALIDAANAEGIAVLSDHGFGGAGDRAIFLNRFLEARGWLRFRAGGALSRAARGAALAALPSGLAGAAFRAAPAGLLGSLEARARYGGIDFARTHAWSDEMNYAVTVHLNLAGREPLGLMKTSEIDDLERDFLEWRVDGERVVARIHRREQLYRGPWVHRSADLVLELTEPGGYSWTSLPSARSRAESALVPPSEYGGGKGEGMNGTHRRDGLWALSGKNIQSGVSMQMGVSSLLPTAATALGMVLPDSVDGAVVQGVFSRPIPASWVDAAPAAAEAVGLTSAESASLRARLRSLGYL